MDHLEEGLEWLSHWMEQNNLGGECKKRRRRAGQAEVHSAELEGNVLAICGIGTIQADSLFNLMFVPHGLETFIALRCEQDTSTWAIDPPVLQTCCTEWAGMLFAVVSKDNILFLWSLASGELLLEVALPKADFGGADGTSLAVNDTWVMVAAPGVGLLGVNWQEPIDEELGVPHFFLDKGVEKQVLQMAFDCGDQHHLWLSTEHGPRVLDTSTSHDLHCLANPMAVPGLPWHVNDLDYCASLHVHHTVAHNEMETCELCRGVQKSVSHLRLAATCGPRVIQVESCDSHRAVVTSDIVYYINTDTGFIEKMPVKTAGVVCVKVGPEGIWTLWADNTLDYVGSKGTFSHYFEIPEDLAVDWAKIPSPTARMAVCYDGLRLATNQKTVVFFSV